MQGKGKSKSDEGSLISKAFVRRKEWDQKEELLDIIYWMRQVVGLLVGLVWGVVPLYGIVGLLCFFAISLVLVYLYHGMFHGVDGEEFGGVWELGKEGMMTSFALFLVTWIVTYTSVHSG